MTLFYFVFYRLSARKEETTSLDFFLACHCSWNSILPESTWVTLTIISINRINRFLFHYNWYLLLMIGQFDIAIRTIGFRQNFLKSGRFHRTFLDLLEILSLLTSNKKYLLKNIFSRTFMIIQFYLFKHFFL